MKHLFTLTTIILFLCIETLAQTYPPSCVITAPHTNAYFKENTDVVIRVYSTDIGKSSNNGTVTKVEFYNGAVKLGETTTHINNTFTYTWECVPAGKHTIKAISTNSSGTSFTSANLVFTVGTAEVIPRGMSSDKGKYIANIISGSANNDYMTYWNGVTAENGCKWGSVESTRDVMNWSGADVSYNYAKNNNLMFRYHAIAWGSQYPTWLEGLSTDVTAFRAEIEEYMAAVAARYEYMDQIDVLNENLYLNTWDGNEHQLGTPYFRAGLGGTGATGYDWLIWLFTKAREYFPNSKLVMNDFELVNNTAGINEMLDAVKVLRDRGLIDGFGTQSHCFNVDAVQNNPNTLNSNLNLMATSGLPIFVTELDLNGGNTVSEATQLTSYQNLFPVYWTNPNVAGITLWGYVEGSTWKTGTGILNSDRSERSSMVWLKDYINGVTNVGYPFAVTNTCVQDATIPTVSITSPSTGASINLNTDIVIEADASDSDGTITLVEFYEGSTKLGEDASFPYTYTWSGATAGSHILTAVATDNDNKSRTSSQITINVEAPDLDGEIVIRAIGVVGDEIINLEVDGVVIETFTLGTTYQDFTTTANVNGTIVVNYTNDDGADRDAQIDYITVAGVKYEAEDQAINTGYYANGSCGGGSNSELMHCSGYIQFETEPVTPIDNCPNDPNKTEPGECGCGVVEGTCNTTTVELKAGWNLIGCPLDGDTPIESALSSIWSNVEIVKDMEAFYLITNAPELNLLKNVSWGKGYLVRVSQDCTLDWIAR